MKRLVYMINSYTIDGESFIFNDNHGTVIRCEDCVFHNNEQERCKIHKGSWEGTDFCSKGKEKK